MKAVKPLSKKELREKERACRRELRQKQQENQKKMAFEAKLLKEKIREDSRKNRTLRMNRMEKRLWFFLNHRDQVYRALLALVGFVLFSGLQMLMYQIPDIETALVSFDITYMPLLILMAVFGLIPGMFGFVATLIYQYVTNAEYVYMLAIVLLAQILFYRAVKARRLFFISHCLVVALELALITGPVWNTIYLIVHEKGLSSITWQQELSSFAGAIPQAILVVVIVRILLLSMPEEARHYVYMGDYYSCDPEVVARVEINRRPSRIEKKITRLIIIEAVTLGIAAAGFSNLLLPDVADSVLEEMHENRERNKNFFNDIMDTFSPTEDSDTGETTEVTGGGGVKLPDEDGAVVRRRFVMNEVGLAFDLKLIMMILNIAIPFVAIATFIAKLQIAVPIDRMAGAMKEFSDSPDDEKETALHTIHSLDIITNDEIGMLYGTMDQMAEDVVGYVESVRREQQLQEDLRVAKASAEAKNQFFSQMSHELRTPINAVLGLDEMIIRESRESSIKDYAIDIKSAGRSLLSLINDILDNSKLEAGKMDIIPVDYELSSLVNDLINMIQGKAEDKGLVLNVDINNDIPHLLVGDEVRLRQVILNILTNAVKYTEKGSVTFKMTYEKTTEDSINLFVEVVDTGIGIKEEDLEVLCTPFARIEEKRNRNVEGTGLGMSIVKQLLELMGSRLEVSSVYGEGSNFHFTVEQKVTKWEPIGDFSESYERAKAAFEEYERSFVAPEARVLVVDDTRLNLTVAEGLIKETLVQVDTADSGAAALDLVRNRHYDIIFLDHMMPEMDGIETLKAMKVLEGNQCLDTPVIALTANAVSGARAMYMEAGFDDYLTKPIDSKRFEAMIMQYLPENLVQPPESAPEYVYESVTQDTGGDAEGKQVKYQFLKEITGIDYDTAILNTGNEELLLAVLTDYVEAIPSKSAEIEKYWKEADYHNYGILVHALKSSSRLIGAGVLSETALAMEDASHEAEKGNAEAIAQIDETTPVLLKEYRSYFNKIGPAIGFQTDEDTRPLIGEDDLKEALFAMKEFVSVFDFDSADMVMAQLKDYRVPEGDAEKFEEIRQALANVDQAKLMELLEN